MAKSIEIDRARRLRDEPHQGHNRWHADIPPVIEAEPGEEVTLETRDANLRVSNVVDVPNVTVSALPPEDLFRS